MGNKQKQLEKLRKKIINRVNKDVWFYPEYEGIKGYLGTQNLVFIGPNPSYNKFPTRHTNFFYEQLKINRFKNAHLTDLVKIRTFNKDSENIPVSYTHCYTLFSGRNSMSCLSGTPFAFGKGI